MPLRLAAFSLSCCLIFDNCARAGGCAASNYPFLTSKERDNETGLDFFEARYYSSSQGRFTSGDPLLESAEREMPQSWNRYSYVLNNPLIYTDPTGEIWVRSGSGDIVWFSQQRWDEEISKLKDSNGNAVYTPLTPSEMEFNTNFGRVRLNPNGPDANAAKGSDAYLGFSIVGDNKTDFSVALAAGIAIGARGRNPILLLGGATIATLWILSNPINQGLPLVDPNVYTQGQRDQRKANPDRVEAARRLVEQLRDELAKLESKPNKTPDDKKLVDKIKAAIRKQVDRMKKSETHGRKGRALKLKRGEAGMSLFTFFLDYRGGTYISQVRARNYLVAPRVWAKKLELRDIPDVSDGFRENLLKSMEFEKPVALEGVRNTWCCGLIYTKRAILHFTQTVETSQAKQS